MSIFGKKVLGIDIGTDAIKVVELSVWGGHKKLENYGEIKSSLVSSEPLLLANEAGELTASKQISSVIKEILKEAKITTKKAIFSLPDFLTFAAYFDLPPMPEKEVPGAVYYNAARYLTLPISEVTLDWKIIPSNYRANNSAVRIFLIAVPNKVVRAYQEIAKLAGLELLALEPEVFGLSRALVGNNQSPICLIDIGAKTSTINIIDKGFLKRSYSFNFNSNQLSNAVSDNIKSIIDPLILEVKNILDDFSTKEKIQISTIYLTGGTANRKELKDYFMANFKVNILVPDCFSNFSYPKILKESLSEMAPRFSVSTGVALLVLEI